MKRYNIDAPSSSQYEEHPEGEWVRYEDANAWWNEVKDLPRLADVIEIADLKKELEPLRLGRDFWNSVDQRHPAVELLIRVRKDWNRPDMWAGDVRRYLDKIGVKP